MALAEYIFPPKPDKWTKETLRSYLLGVRDSYVLKTAEWLIPTNVDTILFNIAVLVINNDEIWDAVSSILLNQLAPEQVYGAAKQPSQFELDIARELLRLIK